MPKVGESVLTFDAYEDGTDYYGMAEVKLPDVSNLTTTVSGAGISGNVEASILGFVDAMSMTMNFRTVTETSFRLAEPRRHTLDLSGPAGGRCHYRGDYKTCRKVHRCCNSQEAGAWHPETGLSRRCFRRILCKLHCSVY